MCWSVLYGSFNPRRRRPPRRIDDCGFHSVDWHSAQFLAVSIGILTLNVVDALLTVTLMSAGADRDQSGDGDDLRAPSGAVRGLKMAVTGIGMVCWWRSRCYRFMRVIRVEIILYVVLLAYIVLIAHEFEMLKGITGAASSLGNAVGGGAFHIPPPLS